MKITGMRAVLAAEAAMRDAGIAAAQDPRPTEGWIRPNYMNSLGFGIRALPDGGLEWNVHVDGADHMRWRSFDQGWGEETVTLHEPVDPERLHPRIKAVFEGLGVAVREVRCHGWQGMWDKSVSYVVVSDHPEWLEAYDPGNKPQRSEGPTLGGYAFSSISGGFVPPRGALPGYGIDGEPHLTREAIEALAEATTASWGVTYALDRDGALVVSRDGRELSRKPSITHVNHWGDAVEVWPAGLMNFDEVPLVPSAVPFMLAGEMRTTAPFALFDAQYGESPWNEPSAAPTP